ncbi:MAG TPA: hypothetical protein VNQ56_06555, partial [Pseudolabrys sp.]|nr:hypothetical protein [Pseudolabrys sp.]
MWAETHSKNDSLLMPSFGIEILILIPIVIDGREPTFLSQLSGVNFFIDLGEDRECADGNGRKVPEETIPSGPQPASANCSHHPAPSDR